MALIVLLSLFFGEQVRADNFPNPIMQGADPHAMVVGKSVWIYPTTRSTGRDAFFAFYSTNLQTWTQIGPVLDFKNVHWIDDDGQKRHYAWAPGVVEKAGKIYFYYSVGPQGETPSRIGVAVGENPAGPFLDSGKPLLTGGKGFEAIDPMVLNDPASDHSYLYAGGSAGAKLRVFELNQDMTTFAREIATETPTLFTEAPFMHFRQGTYYLSYSHGGWRDASYSVHYSTSSSPKGPWTYRGSILISDDHHKGPGHHSIIQHPLTQEWLIVYHRWNNRTDDGPYEGSREICIDLIEYDAQGLIKPVRLTDRQR